VAGARFVRDRAHPSIWDANHVDSIVASTPEEIDALLEAAERAYAHCGHVRFDVDARTPPAFEARLVLDGWRRPRESLVMVLEGRLRGDPAPFRIEGTASAADWADFAALQALEWTEGGDAARDPSVVPAMAATMRAKSPAMRCWRGYAGGVARGYVWSWEGLDGVGQVESLFVHPEYRHRGLATALLHHAVRDCREFGAGPVVIVADGEDTPKTMYAAMGWRPVAAKREYVRTRAGGAAS